MNIELFKEISKKNYKKTGIRIRHRSNKKKQLKVC